MIDSKLIRRLFSAFLVFAMFDQSVLCRAASSASSMNTTNLFNNARLWCVGRFLIDRPKGSSLQSDRYEFWGYKLEIEEGVLAPLFQNKIEVREKELRTRMRVDSIESYQEMVAKGLKSMLFDTKTPRLERVTAPTPTSRLFVFKESASKYELYQIEDHLLANDTMLITRADLRQADIDRSLQLTGDLFKQISYRSDWEIPRERGLCVRGALIGGPSRNSELVEHAIRLIPDEYALFVVQMRESVDADQGSSLLKSLPNLRNDLAAQGYGNSVRVLRDGKRRIANTDAEEVLFSIQQDGVSLYRFYLIAAGNKASTAQPHTEIQLLLGHQPSQGVPLSETNSPINEATAIEIWDTLLHSLRLRPGAM